MAPFYPQEAASRGVSTFWVGAVIAMFNVAVFASAPIAAKLAERHGATMVFSYGLILEGIACGCFGLIDLFEDKPTFLVLSFTLRALQGVGSSFTQTALMCFIISTVSPELQGAVLGTNESMSGVGMLLGPAIGAALYKLGGFTIPFLACGVFDLALLGFVFAFYRKHLPPDKMGEKPKASFFSVLRIPRVFLGFMLIILSFSSIIFTEPTLSLRLEEQYDLSTTSIGLIFSYSTMVYAIFSPFGGWLGNRLGHLHTLLGGTLIMCISFLMLGPSNLFLFTWLPQRKLWETTVSLGLLSIGAAGVLVPSMPFMTDGARVGVARVIKQQEEQRLLMKSHSQLNSSLSCSGTFSQVSKSPPGSPLSASLLINDGQDDWNNDGLIHSGSSPKYTRASDLEHDDSDNKQDNVLILREEDDPSEVISGIITAAFSLGAIIGPLAGASIVDWKGFATGTDVFAACNLLAFIFVIIAFGFGMHHVTPIEIDKSQCSSSSQEAKDNSRNKFSKSVDVTPIDSLVSNAELMYSPPPSLP